MVEESPRQAELELRRELHRSFTDAGTRAMLALLRLKQERLNRNWMDLTGDDLLRVQGEAQAVRIMLSYIEKEPTKETGNG